MKKFLVFLYVLVSFNVLNAYPASMVNECDIGYTKACIALQYEAKANGDSKSAKLYTQKLINILDKTCAKDFQSCLVLANMYEINKSENEILLNGLDSIESKLDSKSQNKLSNKLKDMLSLLDSKDSKKALMYREKAVPLMESACYYEDNIYACLILSYYSNEGIAMAKNTPKATRLLESSLDIATKECVLGNFDSCSLLDKYPQYTKAINDNINEILGACQKGEITACFKASLYYTQDYYTASHSTQNLSREEKQKRYEIWDKIDFAKAGEYLQKACNIESKICQSSIYLLDNAKECIADNDMKACANVKSSKPEFLALACKNNDLQSCYNLRHIAIFENTKRQIALLQRLCKGGIIESCDDLYNQYAKNDTKKASGYAERSCAWSIKSNTKSNLCEIAGDSYKNGINAKADINKAISAYKYACDNEMPSACAKAGELEQKYNNNANIAIRFYTLGCESNDRQSCINLADEYATGTNIPKDINKAINLYTNALNNTQFLDIINTPLNLDSNASNKSIYLKLIKLYQASDFNNIDYANAIYQYASACNLDIKQACNVIANLSESKAQNTIINKNIPKLCKNGEYNECYKLARVFNLMLHPSNVKMGIMLDNKFLQSNFMESKKDSNQSYTRHTTNVSKDIDYKIMANKLYIYACENGVKNACISVYKNNLDSIKESVKVDSRLIKNVCLLQNTQSNDNDLLNICKVYAAYAFSIKDFKNANLALKPFSNTKDSIALNMLAASEYHLGNFKNVLSIYKYIYKNGVPSDYYFLGRMYEEGKNVAQDYNKAYRIYSLSASPRANYQIGRMYELGLGFYKDKGKAYEFYRKSCKLDSKDSFAKSSSGSNASSFDNSLGDSKGSFVSFFDGFSSNSSFESCIKLYEYEKSKDNIQTAQKYLQTACNLTPQDSMCKK